MIIVDVHEPKVIAELLKKKGAKVEIKSLAPGDYIIGDLGIERKSIGDFYRSIIRKRLFEQLSRLKEAYNRCILVVEGDLSEISLLENPKVFWGALIAISLEMGIPVIFTPDLEGTADFLITLDKRLSEERGQKAALIRYKPKMLTEDEWKLFIVESLPYVGPKTAERLLERFGTVRRIFNASAVELMSIPEIGEKKARRIVEILNSRFKSQRRLI